MELVVVTTMGRRIKLYGLLDNIFIESKIIDKNYHNFAWEYDADIRGGASFDHSSWAPVMSDIYWWLKQ